MSFLIFTYAVQVFVQNFNINKNIQDLQEKQLYLSWETLWMKNFYEPFLQSKYSTYFMQHKQWSRWKDEILVKFKEDDVSISQKNEENIENNNKKVYNAWAKKSWKDFFSQFKTFIY